MRIYRFQDMVAVNPPNGPTFYLYPNQVQALRLILDMAATEITMGIPFTESTIGVREINTDD
jgi:hypothetical protein